jgi:hypothetical protein
MEIANILVQELQQAAAAAVEIEQLLKDAGEAASD